MTGPELKNIVIDNRLSLKISAEKLGMSIRELEEHFANENLEESISIRIWETLELRKIVPSGISSEDLEYKKNMVKMMHRLNKTNKELIGLIVLKDKTIESQSQELENKGNIIKALEQNVEYYLSENVKLESEVKKLKK